MKFSFTIGPSLKKYGKITIKTCFYSKLNKINFCSKGKPNITVNLYNQPSFIATVRKSINNSTEYYQFNFGKNEREFILKYVEQSNKKELILELDYKNKTLKIT